MKNLNFRLFEEDINFSLLLIFQFSSNHKIPRKNFDKNLFRKFQDKNFSSKILFLARFLKKFSESVENNFILQIKHYKINRWFNSNIFTVTNCYKCNKEKNQTSYIILNSSLGLPITNG